MVERQGDSVCRSLRLRQLWNQGYMEIPGDGFIRKWLEGKHSSTPPCRASALAPPASRPRASKPKRNRFMDDALDLTTSYQCEPVILGSQVAVGWTGPLSSGGLDCVDCWGLDR